MKELENVYSHNSLKNGKRENAKQAAESDALSVKSYTELIETAAEIAYRNKDYLPLYLGQNEDYRTSKGKHRSLLIGSFHRHEGAPGTHTIAAEKKQDKEYLDKAFLCPHNDPMRDLLEEFGKEQGFPSARL
jgi:hypothetical protein